MRYLLAIAFLLTTLVSNANVVNDTIPYWHISYGRTVVIRGNVNSVQPVKHELTVNPESLKDLIISFIYDAGQPKTSTLIVKEKNETLRTVDNDPDMGPYFVVPVRELIGTHQPNVRYELDFYYTDDRGQRNLKLGTITFILK